MNTKFFPFAVRTAILLLAVVIALGGCAAAGVGDADPPSLQTVAIQGIPLGAWTSMLSISFGDGTIPPGDAHYAAYFIMLFGYGNALTIEALLQMTLLNWTPDQPSTYMVGTEYTFTWSRDGNTWTWTIVYDFGQTPVTYVVTLTATSSGWDVAFSLNGEQWLTGSVENGGSQGTAVFTDPSGGSAGSITTVWEPDVTPYEWEFTITATGDFANLVDNGATTAMVDLETDATGDNWYYTYSDTGTPPGSYWEQYPGQAE